MTFDRHNKRTSRETKLVLESLGERIAPAVYHSGVFLNLALETHQPKHHQPPKVTPHENVILNHRNLHKTPILVSERVIFTSLKATGTSAVSDAIVPAVQNQTTTPPAGVPIYGPPVYPVPAPPTNTTPPAGVPISGPPVVTTPAPPASTTPPAGVPIYGPPVFPAPTPPVNTTPPAGVPIVVPPVAPTPAPPANTTGFPDNVATVLESIYTGSYSPADGTGSVLVQGDQVGIQVHDTNPNDFQNLVTELTNAGMTITLSNVTYGTVVGMLPISELSAVGQLSTAISVTPEMQPIIN